MLKDYIDNHYFTGNYNCAETILRAANDCYELGLTETEMKLVAGFGGGMQTGNVCGALLGAIAFFSQRYVETRAHDSSDIGPAVQLLTRRFREAFGGSILCRDIKPVYFNREDRCYHTVLKASEVIDDVIAEYESNLRENK